MVFTALSEPPDFAKAIRSQVVSTKRSLTMGSYNAEGIDLMRRSPLITLSQVLNHFFSDFFDL